MALPPINVKVGSGADQRDGQDIGTLGGGWINSGISPGATPLMVAGALVVLAIVVLRRR